MDRLTRNTLKLIEAAQKSVLVTITYDCDGHDHTDIERLIAPTSLKQASGTGNWLLYASELARGELVTFSPIKAFILHNIRTVKLTTKTYDRDALVANNTRPQRSQRRAA